MTIETMRRGRGMWVGLAMVVAGGCDEGSSEMDVVIVENGTVSEGPVSVGSGLFFELDLRVGTGSGTFEPPTDLEVVPENASDLLVEVVGTDPASSGQATLVRLTPLVPGPGSVRFFADNAVEDPTFRYDAVAVEEAEMTATVQGDNDSATTAAEMTVFVDSRIFVSALYRSAGQRILGRERLEVESPEGAGTEFLDFSDDSQPQMLDLAATPHDAIVTSPASGDTITIHAVDVTSIWLTELEVGGVPFDAESPYEIGVGESIQVDLVPSSRQGARIWGSSPTPAEWELRGSSIAETGRDSDGAYFQGLAAGETTVLFTYGEAQAALVVNVTN